LDIKTSLGFVAWFAARGRSAKWIANYHHWRSKV